MLLEHAVWSHNTKTSNRDVDAEVFVRWESESGLSSSFREALEISTGLSEGAHFDEQNTCVWA